MDDDRDINLHSNMYFDCGNCLFCVEVNYAFAKLKQKRASSSDNIAPKYHLCKLFNLMLKHAYILPQFVALLIKDEYYDVCSTDNYRGFTISPVIPKVFETLKRVALYK